MTGPLTRSVVLTLLALDGVFSAVAGAFFLPLRIGVVPFPISAVLAGALNAVLVWAALQWTDSGRLAALPLWTWLATLVVLTLGGPGGDVVFGGRDVMAYSVLVFTALGVAPAAWLLWRRGLRT
ncbi:hypothetical protein AB3M98_24855 [Mycolicibacterium litorale]|nr:hypothetical protein [Mycolicibacterium litorale]